MSQRRIIYVHNNELLQQADLNPAVRGRASLTHRLIASYGLLNHMQRLTATVCKTNDLRNFHSGDYVDQLLASQTDANLSGNTASFALESDDENTSDDDAATLNNTLAETFGLGFDCPSWLGMWQYACAIAGSTMSACAALCRLTPSTLGQMATTPPMPVIINWLGGWHHAQRDRAAGYCYVNDIVLGILILRRRFQRVLYIDLDVHHGDGVQYAFEVTKHVLTVSFHRYECGFYPGTGSVGDCGFGSGRGYAVNFPYLSGISGENFRKYFKRVMAYVLDCYAPQVCVLQCGADAVVGDPLGGTNLTPTDLSDCIEFILNFSLPTVLLGGGGYDFPNASRCWTQLTATVCGVQLADDIPDGNKDFLSYGPDYCLHIKPSRVIKDENTRTYLEECTEAIENNLRKYNVHAV